MKHFLFSILHFSVFYVILKSLGYIFPSILPECCACNVVLCLLVSFLTFGFTKMKFLNDVIDPLKKAIFITGCDTGFGNHLAKRMDSKGYHVFAGCLFPDGSNATSLKENSSQRLKVVGIDVSKDESVQRAAEFVKTNLDSCDLWAVVNNAGIIKGFSVEFTEMSEFQETMEVNAFGPVRVTKAFLPLLKHTKGRVVTVTSLGGRVPIPYGTSYIMSKHAAVGFSDCLRQELDEYGIQVISIEPEIFRTNLVDEKRYDEKLTNIGDSSKEYEKRFESLKKISHAFISLASSRIDVVIEDLELAITSKYPDLIYKPRRNIIFWFLIQFYEIMPVGLRDSVIKILVYLINIFY